MTDLNLPRPIERTIHTKGKECREEQSRAALTTGKMGHETIKIKQETHKEPIMTPNPNPNFYQPKPHCHSVTVPYVTVLSQFSTRWSGKMQNLNIYKTRKEWHMLFVYFFSGGK